MLPMFKLGAGMIAGALVLNRARSMRAGKVPTADILARMQTPWLLQSVEGRERCYEAMAEGLAIVDYEYLLENPNTPQLYESGIVYCDDGRARFDEWLDIPSVLDKGCGDCDDLVPWRLAELWRMGVNASAKALHQELSDGSVLFHIRILHRNGEIEDPSARLGM